MVMSVLTDVRLQSYECLLRYVSILSRSEKSTHAFSAIGIFAPSSGPVQTLLSNVLKLRWRGDASTGGMTESLLSMSNLRYARFMPAYVVSRNSVCTRRVSLVKQTSSASMLMDGQLCT